MGKLTLPLAGHCRCGDIQLRISAPPILTMACHCRGCQRMSASAFSLSVAIPAGGFEITRGEPVLGGLRDPQLRHFFCPSCMSWMFTRPPEIVTRFLPDFVNVRATMLDDASWSSPFIETWSRTKLPWVTTPAVHSYPEFPPVEDYARLTAEFANAVTNG
ncbi:MAG TPA: GFA family protein [Steroidobacteraceae bacterium]